MKWERVCLFGVGTEGVVSTVGVVVWVAIIVGAVQRSTGAPGVVPQRSTTRLGPDRSLDRSSSRYSS